MVAHSIRRDGAVSTPTRGTFGLPHVRRCKGGTNPPLDPLADARDKRQP